MELEDAVLAVVARHPDLDGAAIAQRAAQVFKQDGDVGGILSALQARGELIRTGEGWRTVGDAVQRGLAVWRARMREGFDAAYVLLAASPCFHEYNRRVHGDAGLRWGMVSGDEIGVVRELSGLTPCSRFVDLGCAWGALTAELTRLTGAHGQGLDLAPSAIARASTTWPDEPGLSFREGDMDALDLEPGALDAVVAADTLYFCTDLATTLAAVRAALKPGGRLVAAWSDARDAGPFADTRLGRALAEVGLEVAEARDTSAHGIAFWRRSLEACLALEEAWRREDVLRFEAMLGESRSSLEALEQGRARRWVVAARA